MNRTLSLSIALITLTATLFSCNDKNIRFKEFQKFDDLEWNKGDNKTFIIHIDDNRKPKEMILAFRYATGYPFDKVKMKITEVNPAGERITRDVDFKVRDENGEFIGEKGFDIIDIEYVLDANKEFLTHGDYTYIIEQAMPPTIEKLHYAMEVGLILKEKESK